MSGPDFNQQRLECGGLLNISGVMQAEPANENFSYLLLSRFGFYHANPGQKAPCAGFMLASHT